MGSKSPRHGDQLSARSVIDAQRRRDELMAELLKGLGQFLLLTIERRQG